MEEYKIKSALLRVLFSLLLCLFMIILKFVLKEDKIIIYKNLNVEENKEECLENVTVCCNMK